MQSENSNEIVVVNVVESSEKKKKHYCTKSLHQTGQSSPVYMLLYIFQPLQTKGLRHEEIQKQRLNLITTEYAFAKNVLGVANGGVISTLGIFTLKI